MLLHGGTVLLHGVTVLPRWSSDHLCTVLLQYCFVLEFTPPPLPPISLWALSKADIADAPSCLKLPLVYVIYSNGDLRHGTYASSSFHDVLTFACSLHLLLRAFSNGKLPCSCPPFCLRAFVIAARLRMFATVAVTA